MPEPIRRTSTSSVNVELIHSKAIKLVLALDETDRGIFREKVTKPIIATDYKMYRGDHVRKAHLFHTHVSKNLVFNFLIEGGVGILVFIGLHKEAERHADNFRNTLNISDCVSISEAGLWDPAAPTLVSPEPKPVEESNVTPPQEANADLRDIATLLQNAIQSTAQGIVDDATSNLHKQYDAIFELAEFLQNEQKKAREGLESQQNQLLGLVGQVKAFSGLEQQAKSLTQRLDEQQGLHRSSVEELKNSLRQQSDHSQQLQHESIGKLTQLESLLADQSAQLSSLNTQARAFLTVEKWQQEQAKSQDLWKQENAKLTQQLANISDKHLQTDEEQKLLLQNHSQKLEEMQKSVIVITRLLDDTITDVKIQSEKAKVQADKFSSLFEQSERSTAEVWQLIKMERLQREKLEQKLVEAHEHIEVLNEQILSQASAVAKGEKHRHELEVLLHLLETKFREAQEKPPEPTGFFARLFKVFTG
jgi:hypothetical protein